MIRSCAADAFFCDPPALAEPSSSFFCCFREKSLIIVLNQSKEIRNWFYILIPKPRIYFDHRLGTIRYHLPHCQLSPKTKNTSHATLSVSRLVRSSIIDNKPQTQWCSSNLEPSIDHNRCLLSMEPSLKQEPQWTLWIQIKMELVPILKSNSCHSEKTEETI